VTSDRSAAAHLRPLAEGVYAWIGAGGDSNAGAIDTPDGILAIDAQQNERLAREFAGALREQLGKPLRSLINTHYHADHTAGNSVIAGDAPIVAHDRTLARLNKLLGPTRSGGWTVTEIATKAALFYGENISELVSTTDPAWKFFEARFAPVEYHTLRIKPPTETFADRYAFHLPAETVSLEYCGPAHCDGDIFIQLEKQKVVFLGDLFFHERFPWLGDCDLDGWIATLDRVLALDCTIVIPGHGPPTGLKELASFRNLLRDIRAAVAAAIRSGASESAAAREVTLPRYAALPRYEQWLAFNIRAAYRYLRNS
jgi:glyoxylase-like metal-dependent hydrolase (beta-lactamase superfamily II)